jgi:hypothetical protein
MGSQKMSLQWAGSAARGMDSLRWGPAFTGTSLAGGVEEAGISGGGSGGWWYIRFAAAVISSFESLSAASISSGVMCDFG